MGKDLYDQFHYPNYCYSQTHPDHLSSIATLFGLKPARVEKCRVLELACGDGANLLPMALELPESDFVGIDRAIEPIASGQATIAELNLKNIELKQKDILETSDELGKFDYIIAHGLFSWVPAEVQERILSLCRESLNPNGVAYISYNTYPGCHLRAIAWGMTRFHTREIQDPVEKVAQSKALINWAATAQTQQNAYSMFLNEVNAAFAKKDGGAIFHDDLSEENSPLYLFQFVTRAARHGLRFLSESEYFSTQETNFATEVADQLKAMEREDIILKEQYLDFLEGRSFRQTLLCHHNAKLDRSLKPDMVKQFYVRANAVPVSDHPDLQSPAIEEFRGPKGSGISTSFPLGKAAFSHLSSIYPASSAFTELVNSANALLSASISQREFSGADSEEGQALAELLMKAFGVGVAELHLHQTQLATIPGDRPMISSLARHQAEKGQMISTLLHGSVKFEDELGRQLLTLLDGTRDRTRLEADFRQLAEQIMEENKSGNPIALPGDLSEQLTKRLNDLGKLGLFIQ
jgi:methyltransferase-like protein/cyclopropane fatty-acyl-phospholipid synthase-like methyltransferase